MYYIAYNMDYLVLGSLDMDFIIMDLLMDLHLYFLLHLFLE